MQYAEVIIDLPAYAVDRPYTYIVPRHLENIVSAGIRVWVPFGNMNRLAFVLQVLDTAPPLKKKRNSI